VYLLDTNTCIRLLSKNHSGVVASFRKCIPSEVALCSIVKSELIYCARKSARVDANLKALGAFWAPFVSLPFDDRCAEEAGQMRAVLSAQGTPIGPNDLLIAAIARAHDAILVTHNTREFGRIVGLRIEDWEA
jgi:tRNA(fMet)-specific endonuclease VapC